MVSASRLIHRTMALVALLLAVAWVPLTSHELLEAAGLIHQDGPDAEQGPAHEAADGLCRLQDTGVPLKAPTLFSVGWIVPVVELSLAGVFVPLAFASYLRRETASPPGLARRWNFLLRLALPSQSPTVAL